MALSTVRMFVRPGGLTVPTHCSVGIARGVTQRLTRLSWSVSLSLVTCTGFIINAGSAVREMQTLSLGNILNMAAIQTYKVGVIGATGAVGIEMVKVF